MNDYDMYLHFINEIEKFEEEKKSKSKILDVFIQYLLKKQFEESYYILNLMIDQQMVDPKLVTQDKEKMVHFLQYVSEEDIKNDPRFKDMTIKWELYKKSIKEGVNPNEIAKIIRNDDIEKLQEISSQTNFDFNQTIEPSLYERCSFINQKNVSLLDYAAFFGSVKCFKYLLLNCANVNHTGLYAIAGGNEEIIHLCEQNHSSFLFAYVIAIVFHKNDIFKYVYENKIFKISNLNELGIQCVLFHNYEIFTFLLKEGMEIDDNIINESAKNGNMLLTKYLIKTNPIPKYLLQYSAISNNVELFEYILGKEEFDVNDKGIHLF